LPSLPTGASFRRVMRAQEKWQVMNDNSKNGEDDTKEALINYLKLSFPEYV
jgi:hypothetical protein